MGTFVVGLVGSMNTQHSSTAFVSPSLLSLQPSRPQLSYHVVPLAAKNPLIQTSRRGYSPLPNGAGSVFPVYMNVSPQQEEPQQKQQQLQPSQSLNGEASSSDPDGVEERVRTELAAEGIDFDDLLDSGKAVKLTRELISLDSQLSTLVPGSPEYTAGAARADAMRKDLTEVRRQIMQPFLKRVFVIQALISIAVSGLLAADNFPGVDVPLVGRALGFWSVWLFAIPSLRARKGIPKFEKSALNIAFVAIPLINVLLPVFTRDTTLIWAADVIILALSYAFYFTKAASTVSGDKDESASRQDSKEIARIKGVLRYLDWGSWR